MSFKVSRQFLLAGKAVFTVRSRRTGKHFTFQVKASHHDTAGALPTYFVSVMDEYQKFLYVGILDIKSGQLVPTQASRFKADSPCVVAFRWVSYASEMGFRSQQRYGSGS